MVAYKKLTKEVREHIANRMYRNRCTKEITPQIKEKSEDISRFLFNQVPKDVRDFIKGHEKFMDMNTVRIYGHYFFEKGEEPKRCECLNCFYYPDFEIHNVFLKMFNDTKNSGYNSENVLKYLKSNHPDLFNECKQILMKMFDIAKWGKSVLCVLNNITTVNKLKDEFPEAYEVYKELAGDPEDDCNTIDKNTGKSVNMCDAIEKVRAEYNSSVNQK
mgnify:FL=1